MKKEREQIVNQGGDLEPIRGFGRQAVARGQRRRIEQQKHVRGVGIRRDHASQGLSQIRLAMGCVAPQQVDFRVWSLRKLIGDQTIRAIENVRVVVVARRQRRNKSSDIPPEPAIVAGGLGRERSDTDAHGRPRPGSTGRPHSGRESSGAAGLSFDRVRCDRLRKSTGTRVACCEHRHPVWSGPRDPSYKARQAGSVRS